MNKLTRSLFVACLLVWLFALTARMIHDPDFWWHLKTGQLITETASIPHADPFSHTMPGREWVAHEWLSEVLIYGVYRAAGLTGLILFFAALTSAAYWITYLRSDGRPYAAGGAMLLGAFASSSVWGVRPQMFTLLLASIFLALLDKHARSSSLARTRSLWWLVPLMLLWVNLHGGFALGLALIVFSMFATLLDGYFVVAEAERAETDSHEYGETHGHARREMLKRLRALVVVFVACLLVVPLNPNGARMFTYPFETLASPMMQTFLLEWLPPDFRDPKLLPLALLYFATFVSLALSPRRARPGELLLLSALGFAALRSSRHIPFFALAAAPLLARHAHAFLDAHLHKHATTHIETPDSAATTATVMFDETATMTATTTATAEAEPSRVARFSFATVVLCAATLLVFAVGALRIRRTVASAPGVGKEALPAEAVAWMRAHRPPAPLFHKFEWGGYLMWNLYPDYAVFVDGRSDMYGDDFVLDYIKTSQGETNWQKTFDRYRIRTVLIKPDSALARLLGQDASWQNVYRDAHAAIFTRETHAHEHARQAHTFTPRD